MDETNWKILVVDDDADFCAQVKEFLEGETIKSDQYPSVETLTDFESALDRLDSEKFDLLILDVRQGGYDFQPVSQDYTDAGLTTLKAIQGRKFLPVVFYTAWPQMVAKNNATWVVSKSDDFSILLNTVREVFTIGLPILDRALFRYLEDVRRQYMWGFVAEHWDQFRETPDRSALAYLLARRLGLALYGQGIKQLCEDIGGDTNAYIEGNDVHPIQYYVMPPVNPDPLAGDIYRETVEGKHKYWVLLTPSCDLVISHAKAEWIVMAECELLTEQEEYKNWSKNPNNSSKDFESLLKNNRKGKGVQPDRYHYLPGAFDIIPHLIVDFQCLNRLPINAIGDPKSFQRLATLDSPFAEGLMSRFMRYFGRLGTPDIAIESVLFSLRSTFPRNL